MIAAIYSDVHLELMRQDFWRPPSLSADVVILAGDISRHTEGIEWARDAFPDSRVIYVAGNHEFYGGSLLDLSPMREAAERASVDLLENDCVVIDGVRFIGATLWSDFALHGEGEPMARAMNAARQGINDYRVVRGSDGKTLEPRETARMHHKSVRFIAAELAKPFSGKTIVVTHFSPHRKTVAPIYADDLLTAYFTTDLAYLMEQNQIDLWVYGHSHTNCDFIAEGGCRVLSNQRGYAHEAAGNGFREDFVISL